MSEDVPMTDPAPDSPSTIEFYFDPSCPWTWATSRWLIDATGRRGIDIVWRSLSLAMLNAGRDVPERYRGAMEAGRHAHRVFAAIRHAGRDDLVADVYTEFGRRVHHDGIAPTVDLVRDVVAAAGAADYLGAVDDESWDADVEESTNEAVSLAGPDVGSPILAFGTPRFAISGPIVSPPPKGDEGLRLLDVVLATALVPGFFELKRGRTGAPQPGMRP
jgi:2-hydroxychromene-2-carboxylate isomerase